MKNRVTSTTARKWQRYNRWRSKYSALDRGLAIIQRCVGRLVGRFGLVLASEVRAMLADPVALRNHVMGHSSAVRPVEDTPDASALAETIVTAIEGRFRDWLMSNEHAEARRLVAEILDHELDGWTVRTADYDELGKCADGLADCLDVLRHPLDDTALRALRWHSQLRRIPSPNNKGDPEGRSP